MCQCNQGYIGSSCDQQKQLITETHKYCFSSSDCSGKVKFTDPNTKEDCCKASGLTWGISRGSCLSCNGETIPSSDPTKLDIIKQTNNIGFHTCRNYIGRSFRTFDGLQYLFDGLCEYTLYSDASKTITSKIIDCDKFETCRQNLTFVLNVETTVEASGKNVYVNKKKIPITLSGKQTTNSTPLSHIILKNL